MPVGPKTGGQGPEGFERSSEPVGSKTEGREPECLKQSFKHVSLNGLETRNETDTKPLDELRYEPRNRN